jgi:hypothetical protein
MVPSVFAATTVTVNGKPQPLTVVDVAGKAYVDVAALMQLLGGKATYDPASGKLFISSTGATGGGGAAATTPANTAAWGTAQLAGDNGKLGNVYTLRKDDPLYFRLNSAAFTVSQVRIGQRVYWPEANQKLLVLNFSIQNPKKEEALVRWDSLKFTAVDAMNVNEEGDAVWGDALTRGELEMNLKPSQRIEAYTVIAVPAKGPIPKLMVMPRIDNDGPILRYDLRDQVQPLQAPVADPADPSGVTALETVPAPLNTPCSLGDFDVTVEKCAFVTTALDGDAPADGDRYFVVTLLCKNKSGDDKLLRSDTFKASLLDADAQGIEIAEMLGGTGNRRYEQQVKPDSETRVRIYFVVPKDVVPQKLSLQEQSSRTYEFDVSKQDN